MTGMTARSMQDDEKSDAFLMKKFFEKKRNADDTNYHSAKLISTHIIDSSHLFFNSFDGVFIVTTLSLKRNNNTQNLNSKKI